jgi:hypothetical protein
MSGSWTSVLGIKEGQARLCGHRRRVVEPVNAELAAAWLSGIGTCPISVNQAPTLLLENLEMCERMGLYFFYNPRSD